MDLFNWLKGCERLNVNTQLYRDILTQSVADRQAIQAQKEEITRLKEELRQLTEFNGNIIDDTREAMIKNVQMQLDVDDYEEDILDLNREISELRHDLSCCADVSENILNTNIDKLLLLDLLELVLDAGAIINPLLVKSSFNVYLLVKGERHINDPKYVEGRGE